MIYLHSALIQNRVIPGDVKQSRRLYRFELVDILIAMGIAGLINVAMLMIAAATFRSRGQDFTTADEIILGAHSTLTPLLGDSASTIFGISLLASSLASSAVGSSSRIYLDFHKSPQSCTSSVSLQ